MKYFIFYVCFNSDRTEEILMKGKSIDYMLERIARYSDGCIVTNKEGIFTSKVQSIFIREIDLKYFPYLSKRDFSMINETKSFNHSDLL
jgi:hypothetical protein